jgi:hypothetical protein
LGDRTVSGTRAASWKLQSFMMSQANSDVQVVP